MVTRAPSEGPSGAEAMKEDEGAVRSGVEALGIRVSMLQMGMVFVKDINIRTHTRHRYDNPQKKQQLWRALSGAAGGRRL